MLCFFILAKSGVCRLIFFFPFSLAIFFAPFSLLQTKSNSHLNTDTYFIDACCLPPHAPLPHQITFRKSILILKFTRTQYDIYVLIHYGYGKRRAKRRGTKKYRFICNICNAFAATRPRRLMVERLLWQKPFVVATFLRDCSSKLIFVNTIRKIVSFVYTVGGAVFVSLCERERVRAPFFLPI